MTDECDSGAEPGRDLRSAHAQAGDPAALLATAVAAAEEEALAALTALDEHISGGGAVPSGLLPSLVRMAADEGRPMEVRCDALMAVESLYRSGDPAGSAERSAVLPELAVLLNDPDPRVCSEAAAVLARALDDAPAALDALRRRWEAEPDTAIRHQGEPDTAIRYRAEADSALRSEEADPDSVIHVHDETDSAIHHGGAEADRGDRFRVEPDSIIRLQAETDSVLRLRLLQAAAGLVDRHPDGRAWVEAGDPRVRWLLDLRDRGGADERLTLALRAPALLQSPGTPGGPGDLVDLAAASVDGDDPRPPWVRVLSADHIADAWAVPGALVQVAVALGGDRDRCADLAARLAGSARDGVRLGAVEVVATLVDGLRGTEGTCVDTVGRLAADPWEPVRERAVPLLAVAGEAAAPWADVLAQRASAYTRRAAADAGATASRATASRATPTGPAPTGPAERGAALLGLALLRDPRVVPLLQGGRGWTALGLPYAPQGDTGWSSPGLPDLLEALVHEADALTRLLRELLEKGGDDALGVMFALEAWGSAAAPLADAVAERLRCSSYPARELAVLAAVGRGAAEHAEQVRGFAGARDDGAAALAYWRMTGDAAAALELAEGVGPRAWVPYWTLLAELGPAARAHVDRLRAPVERAEPVAALAYWRMTGDTATVLRVLAEAEGAPLRESVGERSGREAVRVLGEMGGAAAPAMPLLRELRDAPERPYREAGPGWRAVLEDRELLGLLDGAIARIGG